jgi:hypothetical protein
MFKYIIFVGFYCFTQYYRNRKKYYILLLVSIVFYIFLCAQYKKCGVEELSGNKIAPDASNDLQCIFSLIKRIRFSGIGYRI